jgi:hypothetical protein
VDPVATASILTSALEGAIMVTALLREPVHMTRSLRSKPRSRRPEQAGAHAGRRKGSE